MVHHKSGAADGKGISFLEAMFRTIYPQDFDSRQRAESHLLRRAAKGLSLPAGLMEVAVDLAGMTRSLRPKVAAKTVVVMVGDHGVAAACGDSSCEETARAVRTVAAGTASLGLINRQVGASVCLVDVGAEEEVAGLVREGMAVTRKVGRKTANIARGPAMSRTHAVLAVEAGIEVARNQAATADLFGAVGMGSGAAVSCAAIAAVFAGRPPAELVGPKSGGQHGPSAAASLIEQALAVNTPDRRDGFDVLAKVGGFEIGGLAGLIIGAAAQCKPVVIDGFAATAAAQIAISLEPFVRDYLFCVQAGAEPGQAALLEQVRRPGLVAFPLDPGTGAGAVLGMQVVEAAAAMLERLAPCTESEDCGTGEGYGSDRSGRGLKNCID